MKSFEHSPTQVPKLKSEIKNLIERNRGRTRMRIGLSLSFRWLRHISSAAGAGPDYTLSA